MKKTILLIAASGLLAACAGAPGTYSDVQLPVCDNPDIPANCDNAPGTGPNNPQVNFNKNAPTLAPPNVCTNPSTALKFKITPAAENQNPPGSVIVIPKNGKHTWLSGTNSPDNTEIVINIPDLPTGTFYDYTIVYVDDGVLKCFDPRVAVE